MFDEMSATKGMPRASGTKLNSTPERRLHVRLRRKVGGEVFDFYRVWFHLHNSRETPRLQFSSNVTAL